MSGVLELVAVRTKALADFVPTTASFTVYTCPAGETAIVKFITAWNGNAGLSRPCSMTVNRTGTNRVWWAANIAGGECLQFDTWLVLGPGDYIQVQGHTNPITAITLSGTELEGVAD